ncbi:MAG: flagellar type III secretion system pore protein FliP [Longimicrobiales bacterium]
MALLLTGLGLASGICGIVILAARGLRRFSWLKRATSDAADIRVLSRVVLNSNQGLAVVHVEGRRILVSTGEGGVRFVTELGDQPPTEEALEPRSDEASNGMSVLSEVPLRVMRRLGVALMVGVTLVALSPDVASAQVAPEVAAEQSNSTTGVDADAGPALPSLLEALPGVSMQVGDEEGGLRLSGSVGTVIVLGLMSLLPSLLLLTTSFTRIYIVLQLLRQALGTQNTPPGHLLAAMALLLSGAVMAPTLEQVRIDAIDPWLGGTIEEGEMLQRASVPLRSFMLSQTRSEDLELFVGISRSPVPESAESVSNTVLMSAFVTSELRRAFEIGFAVFLPFLIIDLVVAAVLTSMGMFMLPPTMIALPCKLMLFVLMDGWTLLMGSLAQSFA